MPFQLRILEETEFLRMMMMINDNVTMMIHDNVSMMINENNDTGQ